MVQVGDFSVHSSHNTLVGLYKNSDVTILILFTQEHDMWY